MITEKQVYETFRREQGNFLNRGFRLPKDWESHWEKMKENDKKALEMMVMFLNTKWRDIDITRYFQSGFFVFKHKFTYVKFFDHRIIKDYVAKDKAKKMNLDQVKRDFQNSLKFVIQTGMKVPEYVQQREGEMSLPVIHYIQGKIDTSFLCYLIMKGFLKLNSTERSRCPCLESQYRESLTKLSELGIYD
jgi:hypothetical protein